MLKTLFFIGLAGAAGTLARHGLHVGVTRVLGDEFPHGTLFVNIVGSLLFGIVWGATESRLPETGPIRLIALAGFMGAFTTFSTFSFDTVRLITDGRVSAAMLNIASAIVIGVAALWLGLVIGERL